MQKKILSKEVYLPSQLKCLKLSNIKQQVNSTLFSIYLFSKEFFKNFDT